MTAIQTISEFTRPDYLETDPRTTASRKAYLRSLWYLIAPELELQYGVYNSTVAAPAAIFSQAVIETLDLWRRHTQIAQLAADLAESREINYPYLEAFLENYRIKRTAGQRSVGLVRLVFRDNTMYNFSSYDVFTAKGINFIPTGIFGISPAGRVAYGQNEQVLQALDDGTYAATIELRSEDISLAANLPVGTQLVPVNRSSNSLLDVVVVEAFVGGVQEDTLNTLLPQLLDGIASPVLTSRVNIGAQLKALPDITIHDISVIGVGDIESVRDKHGLFAISQGGRGDIYVRTAPTILSRTLSKTCRLNRITDEENAVYSCWLSGADAPAAYQITAVNSEVSAHGLEVISENRCVDTSGLMHAPDIINCTEGAFSSFQTVYLEFIDDGMKRYGDVANFPETAEYKISYEYLPHIDTIQNYCNNRNNVAVMGDLLVKAAIPCKTSVSFSVGFQRGQTTPDINNLIAAVVNTVSSTGFMNILPASTVIESVQRLLPDGMFISDFVMSGSLLLPVQGTVQVLQQVAAADKEELSFNIPPYATANTICFFIDANSVHIELKPKQSVSRLSH